ncbi:hydantoinase B/oxoprolinase family protein [Orrella dioscoreae]|uniref:N-methylhydantoinase A n=1 Tax=Orrella dioscoreae TaxID=1851544 RepID=A0A1C3K4K5_9BURK|nr:hydantoinase B/oxoprolinase family protein [Orrella dioscoreae]SBT26358.1 N-methylhydantoinase A [Orrella dioscoreae]SOE46510.1 N-methylhydantoinase A [Orrella dioscoreae]
MRLSLGVDIGGTFTDIVALDETSNRVWSFKELTTPQAPAQGVVRGIAKLFERESFRLDQVGRVVHATTLFTNALIERRGAKVGFITTEGFRDVVAIGRERKYDIYDLQIEMVAPLCSLEASYEVPERIDAAGAVVIPLDEAVLVATAERALADGCESLAVGLINAYINPAHEIAARRVIEQRFPGVPLSISHEIANEAREYDRFCTVMANAYIQPLAIGYLQVLAGELRAMGLACPLFVMRSNGGLTTVQEASRSPIQLLESGPAAGTLAAAYFAKRSGSENFVALDLGGTTAKLCAVENGEPLVSHVFEAAREKRFVPDSGLPIRIPTIDLIEIGAGGGGIARVDKLGLLKVGPTSAGSEPGPAAYGRGGVHPTVSDANLLLGYLNPGYFANGTINLDRNRSDAVFGRLSQDLDVPLHAAAGGVHDLANESMAAAARVHAAERGQDPSRLALLVTGGGGPIHGGGVARKLKISTLICPAAAGVASAIGLVLAPVRVDCARFLGAKLSDHTLPTIQDAFDALSREGAAQVADMLPGHPAADIAYLAEMRYAGQGFELSVTLTEALASVDPVQSIRAAFEAQYSAVFGQALAWGEVELTMLRVTASLTLVDPDTELSFPVSGPDIGLQARVGEREILIPGQDQATMAGVYRWHAIAEGESVDGPAVVEQPGSTLVLANGDRLVMGKGGTAIVSIAGASSHNKHFDSVSLEIFWRRLIAIVDEAAAALVRTSFSTVVRESDDFSVVLTDKHGNALAQGTKSIPVFIGSLPRTVRHFITHFGLDNIHEGDVYVTNDAWLGTGHLSDINVAAPIFHDGKLVAFAASTAHAVDIGGNSNAYAIPDIFQEGFQIPIMKLKSRGVVNEAIVQLLAKNVRAPDQVVGDLFGQISALTVMERRVKTVMQEWNLAHLDDFARESFARTDNATRNSIRAIPNGSYPASQLMDGLGTPLKLNAKVIVEDERITVDYDGTTDEIRAALNVAYCYTHAFTVYALKCLLDPDSPNNEGSFRSLDVLAPEGSILNHNFPLSGGNRATVGHYLPSLVFQALAPALPGKIQASAGSPIWAMLIKGRTAAGENVMIKGFFNGGMGGSHARHGLAAVSWPSNISGAPLEVLERLGPVRVNYRRLRTGSGGKGWHRGGDGIDMEFLITEAGTYTLNMVGDRVRHGAPGVFGGGEGQHGQALLNGEQIDLRKSHELKKGDVLVVRTPGGGGFGSPDWQACDLQALLSD